jgi:hypothetical protein
VDTHDLESGDTVPLEMFEGHGKHWAHELAHNLGRKHVSTAHGEDNGGDVDGNFPYPHGGIGEPGLALNTFYWIGSPFLIPPGVTRGCEKHAHDLMSYGSSSCQHTYSWISPYTYKALFDKQVQRGREATPQVGSEKIIVGGRIKKNGTVMLRPFQRRVTRQPAGDGKSGDYVIEFLDASGAVRQVHRFTPAETSHSDDLSFQEVIPWKKGTRKIVVKRKDETIAEREVSRSTPWVRITTPPDSRKWGDKATIHWDAGDDDRDPLTFIVYYDAGDGWLPLAVGVKDTRVTIDTRLLPGSERARIRVEATDGVNTAHADSGIFPIAGKTPVVSILGPRNEIVAAGTPVTFTGVSYDAEDGLLPGASLRWESDRDGRLGVGRELRVTSMSAGKHTITLTGTDRSRKSGTARITVTVGGPSGKPSAGKAAAGSVNLPRRTDSAP